MKSSDIKLENTSKMFEYEKISRELENCNDVDSLKELVRCYCKLYLKQQEVLSNLLKNGQ